MCIRDRAVDGAPDGRKTAQEQIVLISRQRPLGSHPAATAVATPNGRRTFFVPELVIRLVMTKMCIRDRVCGKPRDHAADHGAGKDLMAGLHRQRVGDKLVVQALEDGCLLYTSCAAARRYSPGTATGPPSAPGHPRSCLLYTSCYLHAYHLPSPWNSHKLSSARYPLYRLSLIHI